MLDCLEAEERKEEYESLLAFAFAKVTELMMDRSMWSTAMRGWTKKESIFIEKVVQRFLFAHPWSAQGRLMLRLARTLTVSLPDAAKSAPQNLVCVKKLDPSKIQKEVAAHEPYWLFDTKRQDAILEHRRTNAIVLRFIPNQKPTSDFVPADGPHESVRTPYASLFLHTITLVEEFAREMGAGLGRVALVRLKPYSKVYRHYDGEQWLRGRNRYHFVIKSTQGSLMTSGLETTLFKEGDLFFFDNKKMHTAENTSPDWRIHIIFDMKLPR